jgi:hypothetical protein
MSLAEEILVNIARILLLPVFALLLCMLAVCVVHTYCGNLRRNYVRRCC